MPNRAFRKKLFRSQGCLKTRSDLGCSNLAFNKHEHCKNVKGTNQKQLIMFRFCPCCLKFFKIVCLLNAWLEQFMSILVFEIRNNLIFGMLYWIRPRVLQSSVQQTRACKNIKDTNHKQLIMFWFCPCCVKFLKVVCLLNAGLEHTRSDLVFEMRNTIIFGRLYWIGPRVLQFSV